ncbi:hypothetical protein SmJEL517_g01867 [Synchytrium microbalum]|uniref:C2H2-type domain-containing protein n=1 Tax=Synchytrium microbalum TaxID=1806994 RepID=A0A507CDT3_9FUNG|nr:uncharacterized protein SmJEL517_g01867 [Synchytrium microbalum]TPX35703.1 hypothetical protein SmJEL517_g01867 [Synchytrium microbalum]
MSHLPEQQFTMTGSYRFTENQHDPFQHQQHISQSNGLSDVKMETDNNFSDIAGQWFQHEQHSIKTEIDIVDGSSTRDVQALSSGSSSSSSVASSSSPTPSHSPPQLQQHPKIQPMYNSQQQQHMYPQQQMYQGGGIPPLSAEDAAQLAEIQFGNGHTRRWTYSGDESIANIQRWNMAAAMMPGYHEFPNNMMAGMQQSPIWAHHQVYDQAATYIAMSRRDIVSGQQSQQPMFMPAYYHPGMVGPILPRPTSHSGTSAIAGSAAIGNGRAKPPPLNMNLVRSQEIPVTHTMHSSLSASAISSPVFMHHHPHHMQQQQNIHHGHHHQRSLTAPPLPFISPFRAYIDPGVLSGTPTSAVPTPNVLTTSSVLAPSPMAAMSALPNNTTNPTMKRKGSNGSNASIKEEKEDVVMRRGALSDSEDEADDDESDMAHAGAEEVEEGIREDGEDDGSDYEDHDDDDDDLYERRQNSSQRRRTSQTQNQPVVATSSSGRPIRRPHPDGLGISSSESEDYASTHPIQLPGEGLFANLEDDNVDAPTAVTHPFKCHCGKLFQKLCGLKSHEKQHLKNNNSTGGATAGGSRAGTTIRKFGKKVSKAGTAQRASDDNGGALPIDNGEKIHTCEVCTKAFLRRQELKRHAITHREDFKKFRCVNCARTFTRSDALHRHVKNRRCRFDR